MTTTTASAVIDTILVFETNSLVSHRFCSHAEATAYLDSAADNSTAGSMFTTEIDDVKMVYDVSPNLQASVESAKQKLRQSITIRDALNRHGVPADRALRTSIYKAIMELRTAAF